MTDFLDHYPSPYRHDKDGMFIWTSENGMAISMHDADFDDYKYQIQLMDELCDIINVKYANGIIEQKFKKPFQYVSKGTQIVDGDGKHFCDIRGWGRVSKGKNAEDIQDSFGEYVAHRLNEEVGKTDKEKYFTPTMKNYERGLGFYVFNEKRNEWIPSIINLSWPPDKFRKLLKTKKVRMNRSDWNEVHFLQYENTKAEGKQEFQKQIDKLKEVIHKAPTNKVKRAAEKFFAALQEYIDNS